MEYGAVVSNKCQEDYRQSRLLYINQREKLCKLYTKAFILVLNTNQTVETKGTNERE